MVVQRRLTARGIYIEAAMVDQEEDQQDMSHEEEIEETEEDNEHAAAAAPHINHTPDEDDGIEPIGEDHPDIEQDIGNDPDEAVGDHDVEYLAQPDPIQDSPQAEGGDQKVSRLSRRFWCSRLDRVPMRR